MITLLITIAILGIIFFQDWKTRTIHIGLPIALFSIGLYTNYAVLGWSGMLQNMAFFLLVFLILILYVTIKERAFVNPFEHYFGLGDLLFYIAVSPFLFLYYYIQYFILSLIFSIVLYFLLKKYFKQTTIPLAGFASLLLIVLLLIRWFFPTSDFAIVI